MTAGPPHQAGTHSRRPALLALGVVAFALVVPGPEATAAVGDVALASTTQDGRKGNAGSSAVALSADGGRAAFQSIATNLDPLDTGKSSDVYVKDLRTGRLFLASSSERGAKGNGASLAPALSADGTRVVFLSNATNLVPTDTDSRADVYVKDLSTGGVTLVTTSSGGRKANGVASRPTVSADGERVAFLSTATNLDPGDTDALPDVYVKDLRTGGLTLVSSSTSGSKANRASAQPSLSPDGLRVAFQSTATNLHVDDPDGRADVYVKDVVGGAVFLASSSASGTRGNGLSSSPSLSADGTRVGFLSASTNLHPADRTPASDVYVKDLSTGFVELASASDAGVVANRPNGPPTLSRDGRLVAFSSEATNLDPADTSPDLDVYVKDLDSGDVAVRSTTNAGRKANRSSTTPALSGDGSRLAFRSDATNLVAADSDSVPDAYVKQLNADPVSPPPPVIPEAGTVVLLLLAAGALLAGTVARSRRHLRAPAR